MDHRHRSYVGRPMTSVMEAAGVVGVSIRLWSGVVGPKKDGNVWWSNVMMRDQTFFVQLAKDVRLGVQELMEEYKELADQEAAARRWRQLCVEDAEVVLDAVRAARLRGLPWQLFEKCIAGQTPRQIIRSDKSRPGWSILGELQNWVMVVDTALEPEKIERLLTLRRRMA